MALPACSQPPPTRRSPNYRNSSIRFGRRRARPTPQAPPPRVANDFSNFLSTALKDGIGTMKQGEAMAGRQITGQANIVDVVSAVNQAEITLDTVVAVRDKVVQAYQSIMNMPI